MCGICGAIDWSESPDATALVRRMTPTMMHRGPDDEGYLDSGRTKEDASTRLALGMRRLSIIDLEGGHQPIFNEDGKVGAVLNGEIYNFQELQKQLQDRGHTFRTRSDSEVVAHAYEEWGADCVERFQGMFAIAVYDRRACSLENAGEGARAPSEEDGTLFLARDRLGIKPLYYTANSTQQTVDSNYFLFASEVRTLLASGVVPRCLSRDALESYLLFGSVSEPMTLVEGVLSLPPGHRMTIKIGSSAAAFIPESYWSVATQITNNSGPSRNGNAKKADVRTSAARVRTLLEESVRKHLIADVPVGVFLSSGIDSTSLAALASREVSGVHTFTVAFPEKEFSEAALARRTAEHLGTTHQEMILSGSEMLGRLGEAIAALDQPSIDGINTYFVSWSARQAGLKVALSGLGGDEIFGGYSTFWRTAQYQRIATLSNRIPGVARSPVASVAGAAGGRFMSGDGARKIAALWNSPNSLPDPFYFGRALFTPAQVSGLINGGATAAERPLWWKWLSESATQARELDSFAAVSCMELQSYLVNTLLRDTDSMSMAHSLEVRVPFLDHSLVEFVTQLPQEVKAGKGVPKALLISALSDLLPSEVINQKKRGFTFPWATWLRGPLKTKVDRGLSELSPALRQALHPEAAGDVWCSYLDGKTTWSRPWSLYVLNEWTKNHLS
jgi:asparagine synthase (glutamine-hydrolysing)